MPWLYGLRWTATALFVFTALAVPLRAQSDIDFSELENVVERELEQSRTPGAAIAVVQGERVIFAKGFGFANVETQQPVTADMLFRLGSTTKMFTAAALVSLAEEGELSLQGPVGDCVPNLHPSIAALTPHQLLTHTAGLTDESVMSGLHDESALANGIRAMDGSWLFTEPGCIHSYANPGYWLAGLACEQIAGQPYADVLDERLFRPLGMTRTTLRPMLAITWPLALGHEVRNNREVVSRPHADNAATWPAGQMYSNVGELARFVIAFLHDGQLEDRQVLSPRVIQQLSQPYVPRPGSHDHYGYGLVVGTYRGVRILSHGGSRTGYGSTIRIAPGRKVAVIVLANRSGSSLPQSSAKALDLLLPDTPVEPESNEPPLPLSEAEIAELAGVYTNRRQTIELSVREGGLSLRRRTGNGPDSADLPVLKVGQDRLIAAPSSNTGDNGGRTTLFIVRDAAGKPEYLCSGSRALKIHR